MLTFKPFENLAPALEFHSDYPELAEDGVFTFVNFIPFIPAHQWEIIAEQCAEIRLNEMIREMQKDGF